MLQSSVRKFERVSQLLAEGFFEFGSSGRTLSKEQIIASLHAESPVNCTATEFKVQLLAPQTALVTYRACRHGEPPVFTVRSSSSERVACDWGIVGCGYCTYGEGIAFMRREPYESPCGIRTGRGWPLDSRNSRASRGAVLWGVPS
ncbi:nuclear transport factor 2 family protein [Acidithiobacillus ferrooxidans]|uniref:DUF4440 domain-containing protein n=1 Tax=Acidithiobacillus ferrooxidans TaxID=920 RepID=UPI001C069EBE|nr:nuclear transport factor 2 family protein [Acidithiobacillus ferrooxidans]MBU2860403.1 nuclear transport factor 2 family protein [Acidithiobacillus ferrooxidans]